MKGIILIAWLLTVSQVFAGSAATVLFTENKSTLNKNGIMRSLTRGTALDPGDQIITFKASAVNIVYSNGTLVNIGENSLYKILAYSPKQGDIQIKAELTQGKVEIMNKGKIKETLKTPITPLAILGTHINVYVPSPKQTFVKVTEGVVLIKSVYLRAGDSVSANQDKLVNAPFPKHGDISSPSNAPGKISAGSSSSSSGSSSSGSGGSSSSSGSSSTGSGDSSSGSGGGGVSSSSSSNTLTSSTPSASSSKGSSSSSSSSTESSAPSPSSSAAAGGAEVVTFVSTNLGAGSASTSGTASAQSAASLAIISLACLP